MTRLLPLLLLAAAASAPHAQAPEARAAFGIADDAVAARYAEAYAAGLAFRLDDAEALFAALGRDHPETPLAAFGLESVALWRALLTEADADFDRFFALNDSLTALAEGRAEAPGPILAASAKLHRALAFGRQERYTRAGNSFREGCALFRSLDGPDAWFGQGACEIAAGSVPRKYRWLARLLGFRGSVAGGLAKLEGAADAEGAFAVDAGIAFALADATLNERRGGSVDRLLALAEAHPSPVLDYLAGFQLMLARRGEEAVTTLRRAEARVAPGVQPMPFVSAHLGMALFREHQFAEAAERLEDYARTFRGQALVAQSTLHAGLAYEMLGDRRRAESLYRRVRASRDYDTDLAAVREAERRLETPLTAADRALVLGGAAYDGGRYDEAIRLLQPVVTDRALSDAARAEAAYRTGRALQALERWDDALRHFQLAIADPGDPLAKWGPWSLYHAGEVWEARGDLDQAAGFYRRVLENETEFDYSKSLEPRTRAALERIGR